MDSGEIDYDMDLGRNLSPKSFSPDPLQTPLGGAIKNISFSSHHNTIIISLSVLVVNTVYAHYD